MKKVLFSLLLIGMVAAVSGAGTLAYFSDTEMSSDNTFTSGEIDLKLSNDNNNYYNGVTYTWETPSNWAPGETYTDTIYLKNAGNTDGMLLLIDFQKGDNWDQDFAKMIDVEVGGTGWFNNNWYSASAWGGNGSLVATTDIDWSEEDTKWDLIIFENYEDMTGDGLTPDDIYNGTLLAPGESHGFGMRFTFNESAMNDLQNSETELDVEFALLQHTGDLVREDIPAGSVDGGWSY